MRYRICSLVTLLLPVVTGACAMSAWAAPAAPAAQSTTAATTQPSVGKSLSQGMAYATLRKHLLDAGWLPLRDPQCWSNIGGEAPVCNQLPEVQSCSVDGRCIMRFASRDERAQIRVGTDGPYERWNVPGEEKSLKVLHWEFSGLDAVSPATCPSHDFDAFLKAFASNNDVKQAFISPLVKVAELQSDDNGDHLQWVYVAAADYATDQHAFNVSYRNNAFHFVDADGKVDPAPLRLNIAPAGKQGRTVRYLYGMSEGNSYRFEDESGCWHLTEDPQPPSA